MIHPLLLSSALLLLTPAPTGAIGPADPVAEAAPMMIHQRIIIRIQRAGPTMRAVADAEPQPVSWVEKSAPKCVPVIDLAAATITNPDSVDLVLNGGKRLRARLENHCPALAFYGGVYLRPTPDGKLCAARDTMLARSGGGCRIDRFRRLEVKR